MRRFGIDDGYGLAIINALIERGGIETNIGGEFFQVRFGISADAFAAPFAKQLVVIFPELALLVRALGGVCRPMRFANLALIDDREIAIGEFDLACFEIIFFELALRAKCKIFAVRSLKIGILNQFEFGVRIAHGATRRRGGGIASDGSWRGGRLQHKQASCRKDDDYANANVDCPVGQTTGWCFGLDSISAR